METGEVDAQHELAGDDNLPPAEATGVEETRGNACEDMDVKSSEREGDEMGSSSGTDEEPSIVELGRGQNAEPVSCMSPTTWTLPVESALSNSIPPGSNQVDTVMVKPHPLEVEEGLDGLVLMHDLGLVVEKDCTGLEATSRDVELPEAKEQGNTSAEIKSKPFSWLHVHECIRGHSIFAAILSNRDMTATLNEAARQVGATSAEGGQLECWLCHFDCFIHT